MNFRNYVIVVGAVALAYASPVRADDADLGTIANRAGQAAESLIMAVPRGVETVLNQYKDGNLAEKVVLSHTDGSGVIAANGSQVVRHSSAGLADIPGATINTISNAVNVRSLIPSLSPVIDGAADAVQNVSKGAYDLLTGWARSPTSE
ncbi:hypothetical protein CMI45_01600 [Candidatus Pacearchaeota archaeon]|nr:hypothetical protein [Candidatus Pacearchaeota archaeon]|tara:strand:+ start:1887 stop:2333 length:447 start_codon:yes stop_codon:yes gene_type:complete